MQFWSNVGMGSLSGMVAGAGRGLTSSAQLASLGARLGFGMPGESQAMENPSLLGRAPAYPESSMDRLRNMMAAHNAEREEFTNGLNSKLQDMKDNFFESHSYESMVGQDGKNHVAIYQDGKPRLNDQKETAEGKLARQEYEHFSSEELKGKQSVEKETFLKEEKQQVQNFLQNNRNELGNPAVQNELQKMILLTQKKGPKIQSDQEVEKLKVDLPTEEMKQFVDQEAQKLQEMEKKHQNVEDASQEARELIMYQEEMNSFLKDEKEKLQFAEKDEVFLKGPQEFLKPPQPPSLASLLPPYLTEALFNMGIYSID